ncbi:hypothetical protein ACBZ92_06250 [Priestia aryabhattai]|nr:hypothetical protein [Priestia megaterium]
MFKDYTTNQAILPLDLERKLQENEIEEEAIFIERTKIEVNVNKFTFVWHKQKYQKDIEIFKERNSYSKTNHDATFMRMKGDCIKNEQPKASYNVQIATEGHYTLVYNLLTSGRRCGL